MKREEISEEEWREREMKVGKGERKRETDER